MAMELSLRDSPKNNIEKTKVKNIKSILVNLSEETIMKALHQVSGDEDMALENLLMVATEQMPIEQKPIEQKPIEQKPIEQKPVKESPSLPPIQNDQEDLDFQATRRLREAFAINLNHREWFVRKAALEALDMVKLRDQQILLSLLKMGLDDEDSLVQIKAISTLERSGASVMELLEAGTLL